LVDVHIAPRTLVLIQNTNRAESTVCMLKDKYVILYSKALEIF